MSTSFYKVQEGLDCLQILVQQGPAWKILAKQHYYSHKVEDLAQANSAKWWKQTKWLTGQVSDKSISNECFHRFISLDQFHDCLVLANGINDLILSHSFAFDPYLS